MHDTAASRVRYGNPVPTQMFDDFVAELQSRPDILEKLVTIVDDVHSEGLSPVCWSTSSSFQMINAIPIDMDFHFPRPVMMLEFIVYVLSLDISAPLRAQVAALDEAPKITRPKPDYWREFSETIRTLDAYCDYRFEPPRPRVAKRRRVVEK